MSELHSNWLHTPIPIVARGFAKFHGIGMGKGLIENNPENGSLPVVHSRRHELTQSTISDFRNQFSGFHSLSHSFI